MGWQGRSTQPNRSSASAQAFQDIAQRITTVGYAYDQIHKADDLNRLDLAAYLANICKQIARAFGRDSVQLQTKFATLIVDIDTALPIGLIANKLVTNAYKHAFANGRAGRISVKLEQTGQLGVLTVRDTGPGLPETMNSGPTGLRLMEALAGQVDGSLRSKNRPEGGAQFRLTFKIARKTAAA